MKNKKIYLRLAGGPGNQMFQFAFALYVANQNNAKEIILETSGLAKYKAKHEEYITRYFDVNKAPVKISFADKNIILNYRLAKLLPIRSSFWPLISDKNALNAVNNKNSTIYIDGYFIWLLDESDFTSVVASMKTFFKKKNISIPANTCVVNIRGREFIELGWNKSTSSNYYIPAMSQMLNRYNIKKFIVRTDDVAYSKELLKSVDYEVEYFENEMDTDFYTVSNSKYKIIGGSSFSIWAVLLGYDLEDGAIIAPSWKVKLPNQIEFNNE